jgi:hypothetical protein
MKYLLYILLILSLIGCAKKEKPVIEEQEQTLVPKEGEVIEIQLSNSHDYKHEFKLSEIAEEVSYIPLETNKDCLIGNRFSQPVFTTEYIFIETGGIVFQFDKQGKFIRRINKSGQGPTECYTRYFAVCEKKEMIYIFDNFNLSVYIFDFSAKHIKTIKNPFPYKKVGTELERTPDKITCDKEGNIFYIFYNGFGDMRYKFVVMNDEGEILRKSPNYIKYNIEKEVATHVGTIGCPIYEVGDVYYYNDEFNDTIFRINKDYTTSAAYIIKIPNRLTLEDQVKAGAGIIRFSDLLKNRLNYAREDKQYIYIYHTYSPSNKDSFKFFLSCYNKQTNQLMENINPNIKNDWDGGENILISSYYQNQDLVYTMLQPFEMKEMLADATNKKEAKFPEKQTALKELVDNMEEDDNPFIMILKLK